MTPRLRLTLRCLRLLAVLTATALPVYGAAVAYGGTAAYTAEPGPARAPATGHGEEQRGPTRHASPEHSPPRHSGPAGPAGGHRGQERPGDDGPSPEPSAPVAAHRDTPTPVPMPSDSASASVRPAHASASASPSRAGSLPGEGRMRPGRPDRLTAEAEEEDDVQATATPAAQPAEPETTDLPAASEPPAESGLDSAAPPRADTRQAAQDEAAAEPVLRILPLGSGLVLIGLGLGLALLGLRLRRS
ncbi:hypothetical protein GT039_29805 [Streptomyces sp. SID2955]|nr:hypothetical protein [Streptomyces sp. SID2955]